MHLPPAVNHPARVAERIATLDLISNGRVEFGTGESSSVGELGGFNIDPADKRAQWEEALEVAIRCMIEEPFPGFKGEHIEMPARNVVPKPLQKPHPPVWVACTRPAIGADGRPEMHRGTEFRLHRPGTAHRAGQRLLQGIRGERRARSRRRSTRTSWPSAVTCSMMVAQTDEQALERLGKGGGFFSFGIMHYYMTGVHTPGRTGVWKRYLEEVEKDPTLAYGPGRGAIGSPATVREFLRGYEDSGVDELILLLNPRSHESTMEAIELMGKEVLPEFIERDQKAVADKAKRLEPVIEKVEARRQESTAPQVRRKLLLRRPAHRPWRQVHRERDPRGHGRDERGPRPGGAARQGRGSSASDTGRRLNSAEFRGDWDGSTTCGATTAAVRW